MKQLHLVPVYLKEDPNQKTYFYEVPTPEKIMRGATLVVQNRNGEQKIAYPITESAVIPKIMCTLVSPVKIVSSVVSSSATTYPTNTMFETERFILVSSIGQRKKYKWRVAKVPKNQTFVTNDLVLLKSRKGRIYKGVVRSGVYSVPAGFLDLLYDGKFEPVEILGTFELEPLGDD